MNRTPKTVMVAGVAGGYLLGRTKKGKLALVLGLLYLARRLGVEPQELIAKGAEKVGAAPKFAELGDQVRDDLMKAAHTALTSTVNRRIDSLSDALRERTDGMPDTHTGDEPPEADPQTDGQGREPRQKAGKHDGSRGPARDAKAMRR